MNGKVGSQSRSLLLVIVAVGAGLVGVAGYWSTNEPLDTDRYYMHSSAGAVMFEHRTHADASDGCESCHHDMFLSESRQACDDCHGGDFTAGDFDHDELKAIEAHTCGTCHQIDGSAQAQSCRKCHPAAQEAEQVIVACIKCHDDDYTPDLLTHDEMQEMHVPGCESCHNCRSISEVYHEQCNRCHLAEDSERFAAGDGSVRCEMCHLK